MNRKKWRTLDDRAVSEVALYRPRKTWQRLDILPFAVAYAFLHGWSILGSDEESKNSGSSNPYPPTACLYLLPIVLSLHVLTFFACQWSIRIRCTVGLIPVPWNRVTEATLVRVRPTPNSGVEALVPISHRPIAPGGDDAGSPRDGSSLGRSESPIAGPDGSAESLDPPQATFTFQKTVFWWVPDHLAASGSWKRVDYPTNSRLSAYLQCRGYEKPAQYEAGAHRWGDNQFEIPMPLFGDLLAEHAVAPMFVFQTVCVGLWSLDEYWYYAIFTLVMLLVFESTVCYQRLQSVSYLRDMLRPPYPIRCFRNGMWRTVSTVSLLPGDIVSLTSAPDRLLGGGYGGAQGMRAPSEQMVPCDLLLLRGSCIVNEAMLTGESVAQRKDCLAEVVAAASAASGGSTKGLLKSPPQSSSSYSSLASAADESQAPNQKGAAPNQNGAAAEDEDDDPFLVVDSSSSQGASPHRRMIVFGGTQVLQHDPRVTPSSSSSSSLPNSKKPASIPRPPDDGCTAVVLRTGFESSQGLLMRTILFSSERVTANSSEAMAFIACLMVFAVAAAWYVLTQGLADERRNRFKLYLHCIMIVTSVVPPELPMELSLAVTNSLAALAKLLVYCTEPFRIPFGGRVDVCCFDKTGTLTSDNLEFLGTVATTTAEHEESVAAAAAAPRTVIEPPLAGALSSATSRQDVAAMVLGCCHDVVLLHGRHSGDPMELALVEGSGFGLLTPDRMVKYSQVNPHPLGGGGGGLPIGMGSLPNLFGGGCGGRGGGGLGSGPSMFTVLRRFPFTSDLRRMSVVVSVAGGGGGSSGSSSSSFGLGVEHWVLTKGAPEALGPLLDPQLVPPHYAATYRHHMSRGLRVIALAAKRIVVAAGTPPPPAGGGGGGTSGGVGVGFSESVSPSLNAALGLARSELESNLTFVGFAVLDCPLKRDSRDVIEKLRASKHRCVMITGDGALTAADVGRRVGMLHAKDADTTSADDSNDGSSSSNSGKALVLVVTAKARQRLAELKEKSSSTTGESMTQPPPPGSGSKRGGGDSLLFQGLEWRSLVAGYDDEVVADEDDDALLPAAGSLILGSGGGGGDDDSRARLAFSPLDTPELAASGWDLVLTGEGLAAVVHFCEGFAPSPSSPTSSSSSTSSLSSSSTSSSSSSSFKKQVLESLVPSVTVFARVAPQQKELVVASLNGAGHFTLMCGDGTNDVGALKQAHVGVSLLNNPELEKRVGRHLERHLENANPEPPSATAASAAAAPSSPPRARAPPPPPSSPGSPVRKPYRKEPTLGGLRVQAEVDAVSELERVDPTLVQLGDASIASPFTSKRTSVDCVLAVVRQGRCTLVTTTQVYKILALNCLVTAFTLSTLYLHGVKQGDTQMTITGLLVAALFFFSSQAPPLEELAPQRPLAKLFCSSVGVSVIGQTSVHVLTLLGVLRLAHPWLDPEEDDAAVLPDTEFKPNLLNSLTFVVGCWMQLNTFAANYSGAPFTTPLREHKPLWHTLLEGWALTLVCCLDLVPYLRYWLELVPLPGALLPTSQQQQEQHVGQASEMMMMGVDLLSDTGGFSFRGTLIGMLLANSAAVFVIEKVARSLMD